MGRIARNLFLVLCSALLGSTMSPAAGGDFSQVRLQVTDGPSLRLVQRPSEVVSLNDAIVRAQRRFPGRVVKAETRGRGDRLEHVVRIINDRGRVRTFRIDAQTGEFL